MKGYSSPGNDRKGNLPPAHRLFKHVNIKPKLTRGSWMNASARFEDVGAWGISVFCRVKGGMWKQEVPAMIAPEGFQTKERFIAFLTPILSWPLEAALGLSTG